MNPVRRVTAVILAALLGLGLVATSQPGAGAAGPDVPGLTVTTAVPSLNKPWDLGFAPDGTMVFTIKSGSINARVGGSTVVMATPSDVQVIGEAGMLGLAIDPAFTSNRRIYTCFVSNKAGVNDVRIVRWQVAADYASLSNRADIVTGMPVSSGRHSGCRPRFGPDGNLWVGTGDAAMPTVPQNKSSLGGKVLRVDTDGDGVPGNAGIGFRPEIYSYGHRNVQGIAFRPSDGKPYSVEHGTDCDDEVNALEPGANFGWDPVNPGDPNNYNESRPMTDLVKFPGAKSAVWSSGCPTIAPSGAAFITGSQWRGWDGALALAVLKDSQLRVLNLNAAGTAVVSSAVRVTDQGRLRSVVQGPDGDLYIARDSSSGSIVKVGPDSGCGQGGSGPFTDVGGNHPFCADIDWIALEDIAQGFDDGTYRPSAPMTRQAAAAFLHAFDGSPAVSLPNPATFDDVASGHPFATEIEWLAQSGTAAGFDDGTFRPTETVTRQAMASFLYRLAGEPPVPLSVPWTFADVPPEHPFASAIAWMEIAGITTGFDDDTFRPAAPVTRQAAAAFLHRAEAYR